MDLEKTHLEKYKTHPGVLDKAAYISYLGTFLGFKYYEMDGDHIREVEDVDFALAGNFARYTYVPRPQIWMEYTIAKIGKAPLLLHETIETILMVRYGWTYDKAHNRASEFELSFRKRYKTVGNPFKDFVKELKRIGPEIMEKKSDKQIVASVMNRVAYGEPDFSEPFELTQKVEQFIEKYHLEKDIEKLEGSEGDDPMAKLTKETQNELKKSWDTFMENEMAHERIDAYTKSLEDDVKNLLDAAGIKADKVRGQFDHHQMGYYSIWVDIELGGEKWEIAPSEFYWQGDISNYASEIADSWNWAAWLLMDESPFGSDTFANEYEYSEFATRIDNLDPSGETEDMVEKAIEEIQQMQQVESEGNTYRRPRW